MYLGKHETSVVTIIMLLYCQLCLAHLLCQVRE